jgi:DNA-binding transcriptional ArsR family regulator
MLAYGTMIAATQAGASLNRSAGLRSDARAVTRAHSQPVATIPSAREPSGEPAGYRAWAGNEPLERQDVSAKRKYMLTHIAARRHFPSESAANTFVYTYLMDSVGAVLTALADPTRRAILQRLRAQPRSVAEIAADFRVSRPAVSQHLRVLADAGLLRRHRSGRHNFYALDLRGISVLRGYVESFWDDVLGAFQAAAVAKAEPPPRRKARRPPR